MNARLLEIEEGRVRDEHPLGAGDARVGRDPDAEVWLESPRVSREHARIRFRSGAWWLEDLGSANGTRLNGEAVHRPVGLHPGDRIELGGAVTLAFELGEAGAARAGRRRAGIAAAAAVAVAGLGALAWLAAGGSEPGATALERAVPLATRGVAALEAGEPGRAKEALRSAAGLVFRSGALDDVPRHRVMTVAMERIGARMKGDVDLARAFEEAVAASARPSAPASAGAMCRLERVRVHEVDACLRSWVKRVLRELQQDPGRVPEAFYRSVGRELRAKRAFFERVLPRGEALVPMLRRELEAANMPPLLHYLALVESGYRPEVTSRAGARGLWQFMPATARRYGLRVGSGVDERTDPGKATRAAARYLRDLAFEFGGDALLLALASYNRGESGVRRALKRLEDPFRDRSYWRLVERGLLPEETRRYVPRFVAAAVAGEGGLPPERTLAEAGY